jgi:hypothetical protein
MQVAALFPPSSKVRRKGNASVVFASSPAVMEGRLRAFAIAAKWASNSARLNLYFAVPGPVKPLEFQSPFSMTS